MEMSPETLSNDASYTQELFLSGAFFLFSLIGFLVTPSPGLAIIAFLVAGWASCLFSGLLRGQIQKSVPAGFNALPVWAFANQITQVINLIAYVGVGLLLQAVGFNIFTIISILVGVFLQAMILFPGLHTKTQRA